MRIEGWSEFREAAVTLAKVVAAGALIAAAGVVEARQAHSQFHKIEQQAAASFPDVSPSALERANKVSRHMVDATKPQILQAKDTLDQHSAYQSEVTRLGGDIEDLKDKAGMGLYALGALVAAIPLSTLATGTIMRIKVGEHDPIINWQ